MDEKHADLVIIVMMICFRGGREFHDDNDNVGKRFTKGHGLMIMIKIMMKCEGGCRRGTSGGAGAGLMSPTISSATHSIIEAGLHVLQIYITPGPPIYLLT